MKALEKIISTGRALALGAMMVTSCLPDPSYVRRTYTGMPEQQRAAAYATIEKILQSSSSELKIDEQGFHYEIKPSRASNSHLVCHFSWEEINKINFIPMQRDIIYSFVKVTGDYDSCNIPCYANQKGIDLADAMRIYLQNRKK